MMERCVSVISESVVDMIMIMNIVEYGLVWRWIVSSM